jgi:hypothetical protein
LDKAKIKEALIYGKEIRLTGSIKSHVFSALLNFLSIHVRIKSCIIYGLTVPEELNRGLHEVEECHHPEHVLGMLIVDVEAD